MTEQLLSKTKNRLVISLLIIIIIWMVTILHHMWKRGIIEDKQHGERIEWLSHIEGQLGIIKVYIKHISGGKTNDQ